MAASSGKDKAHALKDSYVAGLIEGGATAPAPAMPTQDMGEQASVVADLNSGRMYEENDGDASLYIGRNGKTVKLDGGFDYNTYAYPVQRSTSTNGASGPGAFDSYPMSMGTHRGYSNMFQQQVNQGNYFRQK